MPVHLTGPGGPLSASQLGQLWQRVCEYADCPDELITVRFVSEPEMRILNQTYRGKQRPTNVLTFSYPAVAGTSEGGQHDIALCLAVAEAEAIQRQVSLADYVALLCVHAFLHAAGLDHEKSGEEAARTKQAENTILQASGFTPLSL